MRGRKRSRVWQHFTEIEKKSGEQEQCKCNHCGYLFVCSGNSGTTHLNRHIFWERCTKYKPTPSETQNPTDYPEDDLDDDKSLTLLRVNTEHGTRNFSEQSALNIDGATHIAGSGQPFPSSSALAPPPGPASASSPAESTLQIPSPPLAAPTPLGSLPDINDPGSNKNCATNLVKPSVFLPPPSSSAAIVPPVSSSMPTAPPLDPPVNLQRPCDAPILQPFPPPTPPPSLTPAPVPTANYGTVVNRDKVRDALSVLVQDNQFIDMVYRALLNAHNP